MRKCSAKTKQFSPLGDFTTNLEADKIANLVVYAALGAVCSLDSFEKARSFDHFSVPASITSHLFTSQNATADISSKRKAFCVA